MYLAERFLSLKIVPRVAFFACSAVFINQTALNTNSFSDGPIFCTFRRITGMPCPFCGGTRSVGLISEGKFLDAMTMNPIGYIFVALALLWLLRPEMLRDKINMMSTRWWTLSNKKQYWFLSSIFVFTWVLNLPRMI